MRQRSASELVSVPSPAGKGNVTVTHAALSFSGDRLAREGEKQPLSLVFIDPKPFTRQSILDTLAKALPDYAIVAVSACEELLKIRGRSPESPHLVIVHTRSAQLTDAWVQNTLQLARLHLADAPVVLLSDRDDVDDVANALICGVRGYIPTSLEAEVAVAALRFICAGGTFVPVHAVRAAAAKPDTGSDYERQGSPGELDLTPRELSVVDLLREGKPNKLIATELNMQESTVKVHVGNILKKMRVANRTHAAFVANRMLGQQASTALALLQPAANGGPVLSTRHAEAEGR
jgi:DNA-binding NarL/FixJ family response regulator